MGFADMLFKMGVAYDSEEALMWAEKAMKFISDEAKVATQALAVDRVFFRMGEVFLENKLSTSKHGFDDHCTNRNYFHDCGCQFRIEPLFSLGYQKNTVEVQTLYIMNPFCGDTERKRNLQ